jgi:hypothetical protein
MFYCDLCGIESDPAGPGFSKILSSPARGDLKARAATIDSRQNRQRVTREDGVLTLAVDPGEHQRHRVVPAASADQVTETAKLAQQSEGVQFLRQEKDRAVAIGSGKYELELNL